MSADVAAGNSAPWQPGVSVAMSVTYIHAGSPDAERVATHGRRLSVARSVRGRGSSEWVTVSVNGELDASNAKEFATVVCDATGSVSRLSLDLTGVRFMALECVAALHAINAHMANADGLWHAVPSAAVTRTLELCDPEGLLPRATYNERRRYGRPLLQGAELA